MSTIPSPPPSPVEAPDNRLKIFFLPNLFTAGNLFCGFIALTYIVEAKLESEDFSDINLALFFILLACIFDLVDGRVARMGGQESPFGREFDSLADIISFGAAPAFLVHRIVLRDLFGAHQEIGWFIASIYLICGAFRLARFNCLAAMAHGGGGKDFLGFPIPAAAGMVASLTLFLIWWEEKNFSKGYLRYILPALLLFLSWMMVSRVRYPSFKKVDFRTQRPFFKTLLAMLLVGAVLIFKMLLLRFLLPVGFTAYLIYGFIRPHVSKAFRKEIEDDEEDDDAAAANPTLPE
ncbi:MAG: CDP-diacylglycerol--serine O-phosphatidyltransferase [Verrucomicrobia bacterium]|nr:CDP-diacylglycerol--serine O-phosphatidyltransferase [Verrucomicrobiota bacterium]